MLPDEERQSIIDELKAYIDAKIDKATETAYLGLPELVGNLMTQEAEHHKLRREFYDKHKNFKKHTDAVRSVIEKTQIDNPLMGYDDILKKVPPDIEERINTVKKMDTKSVPKDPDRSYTADFPKPSDHGEI